MKKIFSIIAAVMSGLIMAFVLSLCFIRTSVPLSFKDPTYIYVFDRATTATVANGYSPEDNEFHDVLEQVKKMTSVSVFTRLVNKTDVKPTIQQDLEGTFSKWSTDLKLHNIVVEFIYSKQQDCVVYVGEDTRVISYFCISFVIPTNEEFSDIVIYYAPTTNDDQRRNEDYQTCEPLVIKGIAKKIMKYIKTL